MKYHPLLLPLLTTAFALVPQFSPGLGIRLPDQDAAAIARGNAFTATADNPSAIYYNPAGITQLDGVQVQAGVHALSFDVSVDPSTPGRSFDSSYENHFLPQFYASWKPAKLPVAFGFGIYAPFGLSLEYPDDTPFRTTAKKGSIQFITYSPVIAVEVFKGFSIAAGLNINQAEAELEQGVASLGDKFNFQGNDTSYGFNVGVLFKPHRMHSFGLTYRSATTMDFEGQTHLRTNPFTTSAEVAPGFVVPVEVPGVNQKENARTRFHFPQSITFGYSFRPTPDWNFEANIDWTDWDALDTLTLKQERSADIHLPFNWESSFMYSFGVTRKFNSFRASAGYIYSENSVPESSFSPLVPDSNRHVLSVGVGQELKHLTWNVAYQYAYGPKREINIDTAVDGSYRFQSHAFTLTLGYRF